MIRRLDLKPVAFLVLCFALIVPTTSTFAQSKKERKQAQQLAQDALKAYNQKNYRITVDKAAQSLALVPVNADLHFWKGYAHYYLKEFDNAISEMDLALSQGFKPLEVYRVRSIAKFEKKDYDGALADFNEGLKLDPNNAEIYFDIAKTQAMLGNAKAESDMALEAVKRNYHLLGDAYYIAADGFIRQKRYEDAEQALINAISRWKANNQKPQDMYTAYRLLGDIYRRFSRFDDAIKIIRQAISDFPNDGNLYTDASWYYSLADRTKEAIEAAQAGIQLSPTEHLAYTNLCRAYNDTGQFPLAIINCNAALKITPDDGETYFYLGRAYEATGKNSEAQAAYRKAVTGLEKFVQDNPDYSDGFYLLGNAYYTVNQGDKAIDAYKKCLELSPRFARARYNLGVSYVAKKDKPGALEQYNGLLPLDASLAAKLKTEIDKL